MRDDVGFQSQQFAEQVAQRRDRYAAQNMDTWARAPGVVDAFQQSMARQQQMRQASQAHEMDMAKSAQQLSLDQLRTQQAAQELMWAKELHSVDMMEAQKQTVVAQARFEQARLAKAMDDLQRDPLAEKAVLDPEAMYTLQSLGIDAEFGGKNVRLKQGNAETIARGKAGLETIARQRRPAETQDDYEDRQDALQLQRLMAMYENASKEQEQFLQNEIDKQIAKMERKRRRMQPDAPGMTEQEAQQVVAGRVKQTWFGGLGAEDPDDPPIGAEIIKSLTEFGKMVEGSK